MSQYGSCRSTLYDLLVKYNDSPELVLDIFVECMLANNWNEEYLILLLSEITDVSDDVSKLIAEKIKLIEAEL